jgi:hypothetical protein
LQENPAGMMVDVDTLHPGDDYAYIDEYGSWPNGIK